MKLAVFCGSRDTSNHNIVKEAKILAKTLVSKDITMVYGGARSGIMGIIADEMIALDGKVIGVMPKILVDKEIAHPGLTELVIVDDMSVRKTMMNEMSDAFVAFPGGCGTMDEIFEVITLNQIEYFNKPVGFANIDGYYDGIHEFLKTSVANTFMYPSHLEAIQFEVTSEAIVDAIVKGVSLN